MRDDSLPTGWVHSDSLKTHIRFLKKNSVKDIQIIQHATPKQTEANDIKVLANYCPVWLEWNTPDRQEYWCSVIHDMGLFWLVYQCSGLFGYKRLFQYLCAIRLLTWFQYDAMFVLTGTEPWIESGNTLKHAWQTYLRLSHDCFLDHMLGTIVNERMFTVMRGCLLQIKKALPHFTLDDSVGYC